MNDVKKHHLRMTADLMNKELYSKKCAKLTCSDCPAFVETVPATQVFDGHWFHVPAKHACLRSLLKQFMSNMKED